MEVVDISNLRQSLFFQSGKERSVDFALNFSDKSARPFVLRLTGGCADMTVADAIGMRNLTDALRGRGKRGKRLPRFAGFALFGGTRMVSIHEPHAIVPGITEVFPQAAPDCPGTIMLGVVPGFDKFDRINKRGLKDKLILREEKKKGVYTIVHPDLQSVLFLKPTPDNEAIWEAEMKECWKYIQSLHERNWQSLLVVYNGGPTTDKEIKLWAEWGLREPGRWKILLIKDSGRAADDYASDKEWLAAHPDVHVAENSVESINEKLYELEALVERSAEDDLSSRRRRRGKNVIPFRRAG